METIEKQISDLSVEAYYSDYFGFNEQLKGAIEGWKTACDGGDINALLYSEEDIRNLFNTHNKRSFNYLVNSIKILIDTKDITQLIERIRYDQKISLKIYSILTGVNICKYNNKQLKEYFNGLS